MCMYEHLINETKIWNNQKKSDLVLAAFAPVRRGDIVSEKALCGKSGIRKEESGTIMQGLLSKGYISRVSDGIYEVNHV